MRTMLLCLVCVLCPLRDVSAGMVTLTFDDGLYGVYEYAFPTMQKHNIPGVVGVIVEKMDSKNDDYMRPMHLKVLQDAGWEIASHGLTHRRVVDIPVFYKQEELTEWRIDKAGRDMFQTYYEHQQLACLVEGGKELDEVADLDEAAKRRGSFYFDRVIGEIHVNPILQTEAKDYRARACSYEREMDESVKRLRKLGFDVSTYIIPYNYFTNDVKTLAQKYYSQLVTGHEGDGMNRALDPHHILRIVVHTEDTARRLIKLVETEVKNKNVWLVLCLHEIGSGIGWEPWSTLRLEEFIDWLKENDVPVVTIKEGVERLKRLKTK